MRRMLRWLKIPVLVLALVAMCLPLLGATATTSSFTKILLKDGITAPATKTGWGQVYVDVADGLVKIKDGAGNVSILDSGKAFGTDVSIVTASGSTPIRDAYLALAEAAGLNTTYGRVSQSAFTIDSAGVNDGDWLRVWSWDNGVLHDVTYEFNDNSGQVQAGHTWINTSGAPARPAGDAWAEGTWTWAGWTAGVLPKMDAIAALRAAVTGDFSPYDSDEENISTASVTIQSVHLVRGALHWEVGNGATASNIGRIRAVTASFSPGTGGNVVQEGDYINLAYKVDGTVYEYAFAYARSTATLPTLTGLITGNALAVVRMNTSNGDWTAGTPATLPQTQARTALDTAFLAASVYGYVSGQRRIDLTNEFGTGLLSEGRLYVRGLNSSRISGVKTAAPYASTTLGPTWNGTAEEPYDATTDQASLGTLVLAPGTFTETLALVSDVTISLLQGATAVSLTVAGRGHILNGAEPSYDDVGHSSEQSGIQVASSGVTSALGHSDESYPGDRPVRTPWYTDIKNFVCIVLDDAGTNIDTLIPGTDFAAITPLDYATTNGIGITYGIQGALLATCLQPAAVQEAIQKAGGDVGSHTWYHAADHGGLTDTFDIAKKETIDNAAAIETAFGFPVRTSWHSGPYNPGCDLDDLSGRFTRQMAVTHRDPGRSAGSEIISQSRYPVYCSKPTSFADPEGSTYIRRLAGQISNSVGQVWCIYIHGVAANRAADPANVYLTAAQYKLLIDGLKTAVAANTVACVGRDQIVEAVPVGYVPNLIINPNFAFIDTGTDDEFSYEFVTNKSTVEMYRIGTSLSGDNTIDAESGTLTMTRGASGNCGVIYRGLPVIEGRQYTLKFNAKCTAGTPAAMTVTITPDAASGVSAWTVSPIALPGNGSDNLLVLPVKIPKGVTEINIQINPAASNTVVLSTLFFG